MKKADPQQASGPQAPQPAGTSRRSRLEAYRASPTRFKRHRSRRASPFEYGLESTIRQFSWRSSPLLSPVRDQGDCQACVAFSIASVTEFQCARAGQPVRLSPGFFHFCTEGLGCGNGIDLPWALKRHAKPKGLRVYAGEPYPPPESLCDSGGTTVQLSDFRLVAPQDVRQALQDWGPLVAGMTLPEDFSERYDDFSVYRSGGGGMVGDHAFCLIGFDDNAGCWIGQNSFGTDWGDDGFFRIAYGECEILQRHQAFALFV